MILPRPLRDGATIGICSPAGPITAEKLNPSIEKIERAGYRVVLSRYALGKNGFLSGTDEERLSDLHSLFADPSIDAIFCARGGSGTGRLLKSLDVNLIAQSRKPFLGFSDVTALQWTIFARIGFVTYAGPLAVEWGGAAGEATLRQCWSVLAGDRGSNLLDEFPRETLARFELLRGSGDIDGILLPGNLALITTLLGTPYLPDLSGRILCIEDISEAPYRFDRMLFHLRNAGVLDRLKGLIVGDFGWSGEEGEFELQRRSVVEATNGTDYPIMLNLPFGHGANRMTLPVGGNVRVDFSDMPSIKLIDKLGEA